VTDPSTDCPNCGAPVPEGARFCPSCGNAVGDGDTVRAEVPPNETGPVPVNVQQTSPRWFGLAPPTALFGLAIVLFVAAVVLLVLESWVAGLIVLGLALLFTAGFLEAGRRKPDTPVVRASVDAMDTVRARAGFRAQAWAARSSARKEIARRRTEAFRLASEREGLLRELGRSVYEGGDGAAEREAIRALDERSAALEREAAEIAAQAQNRVEEARMSVQPTEIQKPVDRKTS
jgi:hypothetical protein